MSSDAFVRRLTAILSADVVDYSRLMAEAEAETVRTIGHYREEIRLLVGQHRGRIVDFTGDNFLAEFPTATNAVECGAEIQRVVQARNAALPEPRRMHFRIGIHLGEVTVEHDRLYGDGVNIAARLEGLAPPGGICVSGPVHEQVKRSVGLAFDDLGTRRLKNIPDPVPTFGVRMDTAPVRPRGRATRNQMGVIACAVAGLGLLAMGVALVMSECSPAPEPGAVARFRLDVLGDGSLSDGSFPPIAVSPDGRNVAYVADVGGTPRIFLRALDSFEGTLLEGSEGAFSPFFSPDGSWVGFFANGTLRKLRTSGGAPVLICETSNFSFPSASWGRDGTIRYSRGINVSGGMLRVSENGGTPERLTTPDFENGERWHGLPQILPGGDLLFTVATSNGFRAGVLSADTGDWVVLEELGPAVAARYQSSGQIVFGQPGRLLAASWSPEERRAGTPTSILDGVYTSRLGIPYFAVSDSGTLVYAPGGLVDTTPVLLDRKGRATPVADDPGSFQHPRFSPDARRLAVDVTWRGRTDIYVYELERGTRRRLTHTGFNIDPIWTLDGSGIVFRSTRRESEGQDLYRVPSDGSGKAEILLASEQDKVPGSFPGPGPATQVSIEGGSEAVWSPDGRELFFRRGASFFAVSLLGADGLRPGSPQEMFSGRFDLSPTGHQHFDVDPTGRRFAAIALGQTEEPGALHLVLDWAQELDRLVPDHR